MEPEKGRPLYNHSRWHLRREEVRYLFNCNTILRYCNVLGGGHGPMVPVTRVRPSYLAADSTAMELPSYTNKGLQSKANTQKRLGFIW